MKRLLATAILAGACSVAAVTAQAAGSMVVQPVAAPSITLVDQGCGPGGYRDFRGFCRPKARPFYRCGPRFHPTPYGCRPNY